MRDFKHLIRDSERREPTIGKIDPNLDEIVKEKSSVRYLHEVKAFTKRTGKLKEINREKKSENIADVLMDTAKVSDRRSERKPQVRVPRYVDKRQPLGVNAKIDRFAEVQIEKWNWLLNWLKKIVIALLIVLIVWGSYKATGPLMELFQRPIKSVTVEGEFHFISQDQATQLIMQEINDDFIQIDLSKIQSVLMADPWVDKVTLSRRWPDTLVIKIAEQKPIARWGEGFLNQRGEIVRVKAMKGLDDLPWLQGEEIYAAEILQQYQDLSLLLRPRGLEISMLMCDSKKSWRLTLKQNVEVALGRDQVMEKMRRFLTVYEAQLQSVWRDVKSIDVRYSNGVAVSWIKDSEAAKKMIKTELPQR